jgi:regulator of protease activity HflC (stomatin/prohibitin superfamily)
LHAVTPHRKHPVAARCRSGQAARVSTPGCKPWRVRQEVTDAADTVEAEDVDTADMNTAARAGGWQASLTSLKGQVLILGTAVLWGTNPPAVRYLYTSGGEDDMHLPARH